MTTALNISIEPELMATIAGALKNAELGRLMRAVSVCMNGEEAETGQLLNSSGKRRQNRFRKKKEKKKTFPPHPL